MNSLQTTHSHFPSSSRLRQKLSLFPFLFLFSFTCFLPHFQNPTIFFFHFPLLPFFPFHSAYLFSYPALSFARFSPASSNLTRSNCVASTHSFTTCAFLTCLPLHQSLQMISSVLLSVQLFNSFNFHMLLNYLLLFHIRPHLLQKLPKIPSRTIIFSLSPFSHIFFTSQRPNLVPSRTPRAVFQTS